MTSHLTLTFPVLTCTFSLPTPTPHLQPLSPRTCPEQRPEEIVVKAQNEKGEPVQLKLGGPTDGGKWLARIFQHEYDHLQVRRRDLGRGGEGKGGSRQGEQGDPSKCIQ